MEIHIICNKIYITILYKMQLLLVDNRVKDVQTVTQSLLPGVDFVLVDFETDTYETLVAKIPVKTYDSVGIFEENYELNTYQLVSSFGNSVLTNVETQDPTLETWSQYKSLLSYFKNTLKAKNLDLMGCNINSSPDWNYVIDYLGKQFQINIHSSNDNTGSPDFGGNWILESGNQDLVGKYFSNNIDTYQFVLGESISAPIISSVNGTSATSVDPTVSIVFEDPSDPSITNYSWSIDGTTYTDLDPAQLTSPLTIPASGLTSGTEYTFQIKAINSDGSSDASTGVSATFTIPPPVPAAPIISSVIGNSTGTGLTITISFVNPNDPTITNYSLSIAGRAIQVLSPSKNTSPIVFNVSPDLPYGISVNLKIYAYNAGGMSSASNIFSYNTGATQQSVFVPTPIISSVNGISPTSVNPTVSIFVSGKMTSGRNYSWSTDGTNYTVLSPAQSTNPLRIPASGLISGTQYTFQLKAIQSNSTSDASTGVSAIFTLPPSDTPGFPVTPIISSVNGTSTNSVNPTVSIAFENPSDPSITNYSWSTDGTTYTELSPQQLTSPLIIPASGLTSGTNYVFKIKAINANGTSNASAGVSSTFMIGTPPAAPVITGISSKKTKTWSTVTITFENPNNPTITAYSYSLNGGNYYMDMLSTTLTTINFYGPEFTNGIQYIYRIKAINIYGTSSESNPFYYSLPPPAPIISSINGTSATSVDPTVSIAFENPSDPSITNYSWISYISSLSSLSVIYNSLSPAQLTSPLIIPASGLISGTEYTFQIKAINSSGSSDESTGFSATFTMPSETSGILATPTITNIVTLDGVTSVSFTQIPSDSSITNYAYSTSSVINDNNNLTVGPFSNFTLLSPAQTSSPLTIQGLNGVSKIKIKAFNGSYSNESNSFSNWYDYPGSMICFKEDTQILTSTGYVPIQHLKKGDLIQTFKHGLKPITVFAKEEIFHTASTRRMADQLYKASQSEYNELFEDLVITGRHSILIDELDDKCVNKKEYDGKYKLQAYKDAKFTVYEPKGKYMIYNFALQDDHDKNYGVYANGLLVECCGEKCLQQQKSMTLV